jgi:hypothetical protein
MIDRRPFHRQLALALAYLAYVVLSCATVAGIASVLGVGGRLAVRLAITAGLRSPWRPRWSSWATPSAGRELSSRGVAAATFRPRLAGRSEHRKIPETGCLGSCAP